jgi:hypothetical protein
VLDGDLREPGEEVDLSSQGHRFLTRAYANTRLRLSVALSAPSAVATVQIMKLRKLAGECEYDNCPAVHLTDRGSVIVVGTTVADRAGLRVGPGEQAVELPLRMLEEAMSELGR